MAPTPSFARYRLTGEGRDAGLEVEGTRVGDPPGYEVPATPSTSSAAARTGGSRPSHPPTPSLALKQAAITARATGTAKGVGFLAFMMWMSGGGVHLFSLMMTASGLYQPLMAIAKSGDVFPEELSEDGALDIVTPRILYCLIQLCGLAAALYKLHTMGLLPTHAADYAAQLAPARAAEFVGGGGGVLGGGGA